MDESSGLFLNGTTICAGPTIDMEILRYLFDSCIKASEILGVDKRFRDQLRKTAQRLAPMQIGKYGQLQEWLEDWDDPQDTHRHLSHLWGLYPGNLITPQKTPDLAQAAKKSLVFRGDGGPGFSMAWKINLWARLLNGDHAYRVLKRLLTENTYPNFFSKTWQALHVDGTFGGSAGIAEMLLQSLAGEIHLLPALPKAWPSGIVKGLQAKGGFEVGMEWKKGKLTKATILSKLGKTCRIRVNVPVQVTVNNKLIKVGNPEKNVIVFKTKAGEVYDLSIRE
jgi:alpha-L-fucosidase 2